MIVTLSKTSLNTRAAHMPAKLPPITRALVAGMGDARRGRPIRGRPCARCGCHIDTVAGRQARLSPDLSRHSSDDHFGMVRTLSFCRRQSNPRPGAQAMSVDGPKLLVRDVRYHGS